MQTLFEHVNKIGRILYLKSKAYSVNLSKSQDSMGLLFCHTLDRTHGSPVYTVVYKNTRFNFSLFLSHNCINFIQNGSNYFSYCTFCHYLMINVIKTMPRVREEGAASFSTVILAFLGGFSAECSNCSASYAIA